MSTEQRVPIYFADVETFARYYRLDLGAARGRIHRYLVLGYLHPAEVTPEAVELGLAEPAELGAPLPGWTVHHELPAPRWAKW